MKTKIYCKKLLAIIFFMALILSCNKSLQAQGITTYQYRQVAPDKIDEFIKRETTYWSKVARKAIDKGTLTFWGLFEKVGGYDMENSSNYLFINTYKDIDGNLGDVWNATRVFPSIPLAKMETNSISKVTSNIFFNDDGWEQSSKADPSKDFRYVVMNYHNSSNPSQFIAIEKNQWGPFIKSAMDKNQTEQKGWGNSIVLSPTGGSMKFNCVSFDLFPTLKAALMQSWSPDTKLPTAGLDSLQKISLNEPARVIYRVVKVESKN
jgi:hypothetical protein